VAILGKAATKPDPSDLNDEENWTGGFYELAFELGPTEDSRLERALLALWREAAVVGCFAAVTHRPALHTPVPLALDSLVTHAPPSIWNAMRPETSTCRWWSSHISVPTNGLRSVDQRQPGSRTARPIASESRSTNAPIPCGNGRVSSGRSRLFQRIPRPRNSLGRRVPVTIHRLYRADRGLPDCFKRAQNGVHARVYGVRKRSAPHHRPRGIQDEQSPLASAGRRGVHAEAYTPKARATWSAGASSDSSGNVMDISAAKAAWDHGLSTAIPTTDDPRRLNSGCNSVNWPSWSLSTGCHPTVLTASV